MNSVYLIPAVLFLATLSGCGISQNQKLENAKIQATAIKDDCIARKTSGDFKKWEDISDCKNERVQQIYRAAGYPYMDLIIFGLAKERVIYQSVDAKKISPAEGELEIAQSKTEVNNQVFQRLGVVAQQQGAAAAQSAASASWMNAINANRSHTCTGYGNSVTCD